MCTRLAPVLPPEAVDVYQNQPRSLVADEAAALRANITVIANKQY